MSTFFSDILSIPTNPEDIFELNECLGHGKNGKVFKGTHKASKMVVAVKILQNSNEQDHIRLQKQINLLKICAECFFVINYYGSYYSHKRNEIWIIFEYCDCGSADAFITATDRTFTENEIATIIEMVLKALVFLHSHNMIHRDIKASNILLNNEGYAKLSDLGFGVLLEKSDEIRSSMMGNPYWMSPQVASNSQYDYKTDIWSLGITSIELSEGNPPLSENQPEEVIKLLNSNIKQGLSDAEDNSKDFNDFVGKCLQSDPQLRPTAKELLSHPFIKHYSKPKEYISNLVKYHQDAIRKYRIYLQQKEQQMEKEPEKDNIPQLKETKIDDDNSNNKNYNEIPLKQYNNSNDNNNGKENDNVEDQNNENGMPNNKSFVIFSNNNVENNAKEDKDQTPEFMQYIQKKDFIFDERNYIQIEKNNKANQILHRSIPKPRNKEKHNVTLNEYNKTLSYKNNKKHNDMCYSLIHKYRTNKNVMREISGNPTTADSSPKKRSKQIKTNQSVEENRHMTTVSIEDLISDQDILNKSLSHLQEKIKTMKLDQKYELQCLNTKHDYLIKKYATAIDLLLQFPNVKTLNEYNLLYGNDTHNNQCNNNTALPSQNQNTNQYQTHSQIVSMTLVEDKEEEFNIKSNNTPKSAMNNKHKQYFA